MGETVGGQVCFHRVFPDVSSVMDAVRLAADDVIKSLFPPYGACGSEVSVDLFGGEGFPCVSDSPGVPGLDRREEHMDMIWHDHEGIEVVARAVKMPEGIHHQAAGMGFRQQTRP